MITEKAAGIKEQEIRDYADTVLPLMTGVSLGICRDMPVMTTFTVSGIWSGRMEQQNVFYYQMVFM